jgi:hypothetical protein
MQRRLFTCLGLAWASTILSARAASATDAVDPLATLLARMTPERAAAARLGRAYLAVADQERLAATAASLRCTCGDGVAGLRQAVAARARADLARGDTVVVDGWVLARAEAETLALIALHEPRPC